MLYSKLSNKKGVKNLNLEHQELLKSAVPSLARRFNSTKELAWRLLQNQNGSLDQLLLQRGESKTRQRVNEWWKQYHADFPVLGLGILKRVSFPSKLPEPTYDQLICLTWLTHALQSEQLVREQERKVEIAKPELTLWQRISKLFQGLLKTR